MLELTRFLAVLLPQGISVAFEPTKPPNDLRTLLRVRMQWRDAGKVRASASRLMTLELGEAATVDILRDIIGELLREVKGKKVT